MDKIDYAYKVTDSKKFKIKSTDELHPLNGLEWYRPNHWINAEGIRTYCVSQLRLFSDCESSQYDTPDKNKTNCVATVIHGLIEIQKVRDHLKNKGITLTYAECHKLGLPFDRACPTDKEDPFYDEHCKEADVIQAELLEIDIREGTQGYPKLFVPRNDRSVFNSGFVRCPERVSRALAMKA